MQTCCRGFYFKKCRQKKIFFLFAFFEVKATTTSQTFFQVKATTTSQAFFVRLGKPSCPNKNEGPGRDTSYPSENLCFC
jgi:hypothetical protein